MDEDTLQSKPVVILRWVLILPASLLAAWLAWLAVSLLNRFTMIWQGDDPDSFLSKVFIVFMSHATMGAAFVYAGGKISPTHKKIVAYILCGVGLVCGGFLLFPAILVKSYWAIWACISLVIGIGGTTYSLSTDELDL